MQRFSLLLVSTRESKDSRTRPDAENLVVDRSLCVILGAGRVTGRDSGVGRGGDTAELLCAVCRQRLRWKHVDSCIVSVDVGGSVDDDVEACAPPPRGAARERSWAGTRPSDPSRLASKSNQSDPVLVGAPTRCVCGVAIVVSCIRDTTTDDDNNIAAFLRDTLYLDGGYQVYLPGFANGTFGAPSRPGQI